VVGLDLGCVVDGFFGDSARTVGVGRVSDEARRLMQVAEEALQRGIAQCQPGRRVGDIGHAVQTVAEAAGFGVVRELVGHGIGTRFHEDPQVPNHGQPGRGPQLKPGMTIAIEPMITAGRYQTRTLPDKWTVVTADGSLSAHFEHTVAITRDGARILTARD
jgi:methionyl aminopeptidase